MSLYSSFKRNRAHRGHGYPSCQNMEVISIFMCFPIALSLHLKYQLQTLDEKSLIGRYKHDLINFHGFRALVRGPCMTLTNYKNAQSMEYKARRKRESKNAKQMRNKKQNCFSHSSASPRNDKQCSAKQCFANQTNRCLADFASRSDLFLDNEHG